jgi:hypothetical protein
VGGVKKSGVFFTQAELCKSQPNIRVVIFRNYLT